MKFKPLHDFLLVKPRHGARETPTGIAIPDVARKSRPYEFGDVVEVGHGRTNIEGRTVPLQTKVGHVVCYGRKSGILIPIPGDNGIDVEHLLLREAEVIAHVEGLPVETVIQGVDGRLLSMIPTSRGLPDAVYENRENLELAEKAGFVEPGEYPDDEFEPGDGPS